VKREVKGFGPGARYRVVYEGEVGLGESGCWVSVCAGLGVLSQGRTEEEAWEALDDAIRMTMRWHLASHSVSACFKAMGLVEKANRWTREDGPSIDVFLDWGPS
jgi:predicted RNase H-like HicB family nuclease